MEKKFTPGPWSALNCGGHFEIKAQPGGGVMRGFTTLIANVAELEDAKLIAAAPAMLSFIERVIKGQNGELKSQFIVNIREEAKALYQKATTPCTTS